MRIDISIYENNNFIVLRIKKIYFSIAVRDSKHAEIEQNSCWSDLALFGFHQDVVDFGYFGGIG